MRAPDAREAHRHDRCRRLLPVGARRARSPTAEADSLAVGLRGTGRPVRLRLLSLIADAGTVCSCDLTAPLGKAQPTVSHHTKILTEAGLITGEKQGRWVWWSVVPERVEALREALAAG